MAALPFAWVLQLMGGNLALLLGIVVVFAIGIWSSAVFMKMTGAHDPGVIVIDEVAGQWIVLLAAIPGPLLLAGAATPDPVIYAMGFFLFRLFDVLKPWPISLADKNISGPLGVMVDDVLAGIAGLAVLIFALNWLGN